jgi:hypothetical protein
VAFHHHRASDASRVVGLFVFNDVRHRRVRRSWWSSLIGRTPQSA